MGKQVTEPLGAVKSGFDRVKKADQTQLRRGLPQAFRLYTGGYGYRRVAGLLLQGLPSEGGFEAGPAAESLSGF